MSSHRRRFARALRKQTTRAEEMLWAQLRGSHFHGAKFRRQVPIDRYVADFYCHAVKLVVDLDGKQHEWFADYDAGRTELFERIGIRVVRFVNAEVCDDLDSNLVTALPEVRDGFITVPEGPGMELAPDITKRFTATVRVSKAE